MEKEPRYYLIQNHYSKNKILKTMKTNSANASTTGQPPRNYTRQNSQKTNPRKKILDIQDAGKSSDLLTPKSTLIGKQANQAVTS